MELANYPSKFLGNGLVFPFVVNTNGSVETKNNEELIKSSIQIILRWSIGTRWFLGEFGTYIVRLLEKQNTPTIKKIIDTYVIDPLTQWEKRIENLDVNVLEDSNAENIIHLQIHCRIISTQQDISFVVPFIKEIIY